VQFSDRPAGSRISGFERAEPYWFRYLSSRAILFVCFSLSTHNALDLDPKKEGECVRNKEKTFNADGKYDKERREPKEVHDDLGELVVVYTAMNEWKCTRYNWSRWGQIILIAVFRCNSVPRTVHPTMRLTRGTPVLSCRFLMDDADTIIVTKMRHDY
jgi:hypothetical protein